MPNPTPGSKLTMFTRDMVNRISGVFGAGGNPDAGGNATPGQIPTPNETVSNSIVGQVPAKREPWFGPGTPLRAGAPPDDVAGRAWDYPTTYNLGTQTRQYEGITFEQLETLADASDYVRLAIETRKDQMSKLEWSILPKISQADEIRSPADRRCVQVQEFLSSPDKRLSWHAWQRLIIEEQCVTDAPSIYIRRDMGGEPYSLEVIAGKTIKPLLDTTGRMPLAPSPAYMQVLKGIPAIYYTSDELIYAPRNLRPGRVYGMSPVQQILMTVNISIRREISKLSLYTEGNIPEALVSVPPTWEPAQIAQFQAHWDAMLSDIQNRRRLKFVPGNMTFQPTRSEASLQDPYDEWLLRVITYCFSLPSTAFVKQNNRATADTAYETGLEEGLQPMMLWFKGIMDRIVQSVFGYSDLEFAWDAIDKVDPAEQQTRDMAMIQIGVKSIDEVRAGMGLAPIGMKHAIWGIGPNGITFVSDLLTGQSQGLTAMQPPAPPPMPGMPPSAAPGAPGFVDGSGQPVAGGQPQLAGPQPMVGPPGPDGSQPLRLAPPTAGPAPPTARTSPITPPGGIDLTGIPPNLLAAVGLGPEGPGARTVDVTADDEFQSDPLSPHVGHPQVLKTLRDAERRHGTPH